MAVLPSNLGWQPDESRPKYNNWRDHLVPASFRGIPFLVESHEFSFGRRTDIKELTNSNNVVVKDQGGIAEKFSITAFVVQSWDNGFDYFDQKNTLIDALRLKGQGILIHPYLGKIFVQCNGEQTCSEDTAEGGYCRFQLSFVQDNTPYQTPTSASYRKATFAACARMRGLAADARLAREKTRSLTSKVITTGRNIVDGTTNALNSVKIAMAKIKGIPSSIINEAQGLVSLILSTVETALQSVCDTSTMFDDIGAAFETIVGIGVDPIEDIITGGCSGLDLEEGQTINGEDIPQIIGDSAVTALIDTIDGDYYTSSLSSETDTIRGINDNFNLVMLSIALEIAISTLYTNREKYETLLKTIESKIDALLLGLGEYEDTTESFNNLQELKGVFFKNALTQVTELSKQVSYSVPPTTQTTLFVAYNRYNDLDRAAEIKEMNPGFYHPGFLPQGQNIRILDE